MTTMNANKLLMEMGVSPELTGYYYLVEAINLRKEMITSGNVTHKFMELYDVIGKKFNSKPLNVERAMRHAVEKAFEINNDTLSKTFGSMVDKTSGKVTVSCFIGTLAELLIEEK
jgi:two-component system response regulator (stage 0 sporulation protein A)